MRKRGPTRPRPHPACLAIYSCHTHNRPCSQASEEPLGSIILCRRFIIAKNVSHQAMSSKRVRVSRTCYSKHQWHPGNPRTKASLLVPPFPSLVLALEPWGPWLSRFPPAQCLLLRPQLLHWTQTEYAFLSVLRRAGPSKPFEIMARVSLE